MISRLTDTDMAAKRCVIFDFDGTLADTKPTIVRTATRVLTEWGIDPAVIAARVDELIGPPFPEAFSWIFGVSAADADEITRRYRDIYLHLGAEAWPLFAGAHELLRDLRAQGRLVAVASSKAQPTVEMGIRDNDALDCFDLVCGKRPGICDTKAEAIIEVMRELGCTAQECIMVGDRYHDVEGAHEAGLPCIGVLFGNTATRAELEDAGAIAVVDTMDELRELFALSA